MSLTKHFLAAVIAITALVAFPSAASAANYCVGVSAACTNSAGDYPATATGITNAINAASGGASDNVVYIAAGSYAIQPTTFPTLPSSANGLSIVGAGVGQTTLSGVIGSGPMIDLQLQKSTDSLSGVTINTAFTGNFATGVSIGRGKLFNFAINQTGSLSPGTPAAALEMNGGTTATDGSINTSTNALGVSLFNGTSILRRISFNGGGGGSGVMMGGTADTEMANLRVTGYQTGVRVFNGTIELTDSLIDTQSAAGAIGLVINDQNAGQSTSIHVIAARNTIVGEGVSAAGVYLATQEAGDSIGGSFDDMLIYGTDPDFASWICSGFAGSTLAFDIAGLATNADYSFNANCNGSFEAPATVVLQGSPFVNFATRDLRPAWDSPIVDAGGSTSQAGGEDIDGGTRIVDGNNDGTDTVDIGALEYQAAPPSGAITAPSTGTVGQALSFSHSMVDPDPTNSIASVLWSFGDGSTSTLNAPAHAYAAAGTYDVTLSATNQAGSIGTATARIVIPVVPATLPGVGPPIAKLIAKPKQSFKIGKGGVSVAKKGAPFFSVTYTDTSKSKFTLQSIGKRKKLKTVKGSQTLTVPAATTPLKLTFGGTWNKKRLAAGSYRLTITPLAADGTAGRPVRVDLKLKK